MARYVVLSFEDDDEAELFVDYMMNDEVFVHPPVDVPHVKVLAKVIAMIKQPTQFHDCGGPGKRVRPYVRGQKYGWWVCTSCKKPSRPQGETDEAKAENLMRQTISQGVNLIPDAANQYASIFDKGWGALGRPVQ